MQCVNCKNVLPEVTWWEYEIWYEFVKIFTVKNILKNLSNNKWIFFRSIYSLDFQLLFLMTILLTGWYGKRLLLNELRKL